jgi:hypothetical protein
MKHYITAGREHFHTPAISCVVVRGTNRFLFVQVTLHFLFWRVSHTTHGNLRTK